MQIMRRFMGFGALVLTAAALPGAPVLAQDDSCQYANDGECDEMRYGAPQPFCSTGTDTTDCAPIAATAQCEFAFDYECDEARFGGTGLCDAGTDTFDCSAPGAASPASFSDLPAELAASLGNDSCRWANDGECDDITFGGTGACDPGTDATDCRPLALGGDDSCQWANDGECDEPSIGTGACASGTDLTDCAPLAFMRNRDNSCNTAFDRICNEPGLGDGTCAALSDTADCIGRGRPAEARDHFFGRDDRMLVDTAQMPWRAIGLLELQEGNCTATLVGPSVLLTAAHCITEGDGKVLLPHRFLAGHSFSGDHGEALIVSAIVARDYSVDTRAPGEGNGNDWAILRLDRPLGDEVGYLPVHVLTDAEIATATGSGLIISQAGYSWDTGENLSGHLGCRMTDVFGDGSFLHECDTTYGDSGSPFLIQTADGYAVFGVDSQFFDPEDKNAPFNSGGLAVDSRAFIKPLLKALAD